MYLVFLLLVQLYHLNIWIKDSSIEVSSLFSHRTRRLYHPTVAGLYCTARGRGHRTLRVLCRGRTSPTCGCGRGPSAVAADVPRHVRSGCALGVLRSRSSIATSASGQSPSTQLCRRVCRRRARCRLGDITRIVCPGVLAFPRCGGPWCVACAAWGAACTPRGGVECTAWGVVWSSAVSATGCVECGAVFGLGVGVGFAGCVECGGALCH